MTALCKKLYRNFDDEAWNEFDLATLSNRELEFLCGMLGIPYTGTKEQRIVRLLSCRIVRLELAKYPDDPDQVAADFKRSRLRWMCIQGNLWKSGSKRQLATVLLNWRNRCRHEGQKYYQAHMEYNRLVGQQIELPLDS